MSATTSMRSVSNLDLAESVGEIYSLGISIEAGIWNASSCMLWEQGNGCEFRNERLVNLFLNINHESKKQNCQSSVQHGVGGDNWNL
mmetsp:Transcript_20586/g.41684  ORF Transcript_20586/g.41684 Transcript_20586/m.41684 type:complete len:87 (-) Transcript_20586:49-309(-)